MKDRVRNFPIKRKLRLVVLATCTAALCVACTALFGLQFYFFQRDFKRDLVAVAEIITGVGPGDGPRVRAFSVASGVTEVASFYAYDLAFGGGVVVAGQDLTGDGVAEIITGAGPNGGPHVRVLDVSGVTVK